MSFLKGLLLGCGFGVPLGLILSFALHGQTTDPVSLSPDQQGRLDAAHVLVALSRNPGFGPEHCPDAYQGFGVGVAVHKSRVVNGLCDVELVGALEPALISSYGAAFLEVLKENSRNVSASLSVDGQFRARFILN